MNSSPAGGLARIGLGPRLALPVRERHRSAQGSAIQGRLRAGRDRRGRRRRTRRGRHASSRRFGLGLVSCQDLSLAGARGGLSAPRSGAFWGFWRAIQALGADAPPVIALENVTGLLTSHGGADFSALVSVLTDAGYSVGALAIDAAAFLPQSRPRVFVIATRGVVPPHLRQNGPGPFHSTALVEAAAALPVKAKHSWIWWRLDEPATRNTALIDLLEPDDKTAWRSDPDTSRVLALMSTRQRQHIEDSPHFRRTPCRRRVPADAQRGR
ncbi:MAG: DNA cytosine methyltransferase [Alphaproteobacteria bacterium]